MRLALSTYYLLRRGRVLDLLLFIEKLFFFNPVKHFWGVAKDIIFPCSFLVYVYAPVYVGNITFIPLLLTLKKLFYKLWSVKNVIVVWTLKMSLLFEPCWTTSVILLSHDGKKPTTVLHVPKEVPVISSFWRLSIY